MIVKIETDCDYFWELRTQPEPGAMPLARGRCTADMSDLVVEAYTRSVMADRLPADLATLHARIRPVWRQEPVVEGVQVELSAGDPKTAHVVVFSSGAWVRTSQKRRLELTSEGSVGKDETVYRFLLALPNGDAKMAAPLLEPPTIHDATLRDCGVRSVPSGSLDPARPVLVNDRFAHDAVRLCEEADTIETGGAVLGQIVRLPQPLTGTRTRIVTVLAAIVQDRRHAGTETRFHFSAEALAHAQGLCAVRGLGEDVVTVFHTHGFSKRCGNCNQNPNCPLSESYPSLHDYDQLLAQLFPSKTTLLPIAGRKLGVEGRRPVLQIHAWHGGEVRPVAWATYED